MDNRSYWQATVAADLPADDLPASAEVVVIGGGVLGACAALWLARAGARPLLIERDAPAAGASGRNGGLLVSGTAESYPAAIERLGRAAARAIWALSCAGVALLRDLVAEEAIDCDLRLASHLALALTPEQFERQAIAVAMLAADGFAAELLDRAGAQERIATPLGPEIVGAKRNPDAATLHSARLVRGLLAAARRHGARLCWGVGARALLPAGTGLRIETERGPLSAGAAIVAANAWMGSLLPALSGLIVPVRGQALCTAPAPAICPGGFGASLTPTGEYGQQRPDGRIIFGGCRAAAPGCDQGVADSAPSPAVQAALDAGLPRLFPALAGLPVERRWAGTMAFSADYMPVAGRHPQLPVWYAGGFSGHGMPFAAPLGRALAQAALHDSAPPDLALLSPDRPSLSQDSPPGRPKA